jgi:putative transposase
MPSGSRLTRVRGTSYFSRCPYFFLCRHFDGAFSPTYAMDSCAIMPHDRDTKYTHSFRAIIASGGVKPLALPVRSPNLNAHAERWVKSVKEECLSKIILFGERSLRRALSEYVAHYHAERNHQGKSNVLLFRRVTQTRREEPVQCRERLSGLLRYYHQEAA